MHVCVVIGTRPEAIKLAPVVHALEASEETRCTVISTGQHREMLDQVLDVFGITPQVELGVMRPSQKLSDLTSVLVAGLGNALRELRPDRLVVQGDTTTALCGGLAAFYEGIAVGHVEAGLRTGDLQSPFPEEANRRLVTVMADRHYAPTARSAANLRREGVAESAILVTGNTVIDALLWATSRAGIALPRLAGRPRRILVTLHRRENHGQAMRGICLALRQIVEMRDVEVVFPVHRSPIVRRVVHETLAGVAGVRLIEPLDYLEFVAELHACDLVLSDSGGLQEEAPSLGKPVLVLRDTTERPEAIEAGVAILIGTGETRIVRETMHLLDSPAAYRAMAHPANPFGDGTAAARIAADLTAGVRSGLAAVA